MELVTIIFFSLRRELSFGYAENLVQSTFKNVFLSGM